jgi:hypothetical protein
MQISQGQNLGSIFHRINADGAKMHKNLFSRKIKFWTRALKFFQTFFFESLSLKKILYKWLTNI